MRFTLTVATGAFILSALLAQPPGAEPEKKDPAAQAQADFNAFRNYLKQHYPAKTWGKGPERIDSDAIRTAFPEQRFYFVFTGRPGWDRGRAPSKAEVEQLRRDAEAYDKNRVSLTVRIDDAGKVMPVISKEDFRQGLRKITTEAEAQSAAAAVLSLLNTGEVCPEPYAAEKVKVSKEGGAEPWVCRLLIYPVIFDAEGRLHQLPSKQRPPRR